MLFRSEEVPAVTEEEEPVAIKEDVSVVTEKEPMTSPLEELNQGSNMTSNLKKNKSKRQKHSKGNR